MQIVFQTFIYVVSIENITPMSFIVLLDLAIITTNTTYYNSLYS